MNYFECCWIAEQIAAWELDQQSNVQAYVLKRAAEYTDTIQRLEYSQLHVNQESVLTKSLS